MLKDQSPNGISCLLKIGHHTSYIFKVDFFDRVFGDVSIKNLLNSSSGFKSV